MGQPAEETQVDVGVAEQVLTDKEREFMTAFAQFILSHDSVDVEVPDFAVVNMVNEFVETYSEDD